MKPKLDPISILFLLVASAFIACMFLLVFIPKLESRSSQENDSNDVSYVTPDDTVSTDGSAPQQTPATTSPAGTATNTESDEDGDANSHFSNYGGATYAATYNLPPSYYEEQALADSAIDQYLSGDWDGQPMIMEEHAFTLSRRGYLLIDEHITSPTKFHPQQCLDLPTDMHRHDYIYIPGEGSYLIENNRLVHYQRGEEVSMSGSFLSWNGMDTKNYRPYDVYFYYDKPHDTLFVMASSVPYDYSSDELKYNVGIYLYTVPDRTTSKIEFVDEIINLSMDEYGLFYLDTKNSLWRYTDKDGKLSFEKSYDSKLKSKFSRLGAAEGEIEFDWRCTFADGFIGSRDAFPEGTFTHPVVTTPLVSLSEFKWDYKYRNIYSH